MAGEERRARDVQEVARDELHLLERERGLAASGRAHDDERGRQSEERLLRVVEAQHLVQEVEARVRRVDEAERRELVLGRAAAAERLELRFVHPRATQEARLLVGVVLDHLEQERVALAVAAGEAEEQPVRVVELRPVVALAAELLDVGRVQVVALQHRDHFLVARPYRGGSRSRWTRIFTGRRRPGCSPDARVVRRAVRLERVGPHLMSALTRTKDGTAAARARTTRAGEQHPLDHWRLLSFRQSQGGTGAASCHRPFRAERASASVRA